MLPTYWFLNSHNTQRWSRCSQGPRAPSRSPLDGKDQGSFADDPYSMHWQTLEPRGTLVSDLERGPPKQDLHSFVKGLLLNHQLLKKKEYLP